MLFLFLLLFVSRCLRKFHVYLSYQTAVLFIIPVCMCITILCLFMRNPGDKKYTPGCAWGFECLVDIFHLCLMVVCKLIWGCFVLEGKNLSYTGCVCIFSYSLCMEFIKVGNIINSIWYVTIDDNIFI